MNKIQRQKIKNVTHLICMLYRFSSNPTHSVTGASAPRSCLTDTVPQDVSPTLRPVPPAASAPRTAFFVLLYQWLLFYKRSAFNKKQNTGTLLCLIIWCSPNTSRKRKNSLYHLSFFCREKVSFLLSRGLGWGWATTGGRLASFLLHAWSSCPRDSNAACLFTGWSSLGQSNDVCPYEL